MKVHSILCWSFSLPGISILGAMAEKERVDIPIILTHIVLLYIVPYTLCIYDNAETCVREFDECILSIRETQS